MLDAWTVVPRTDGRFAPPSANGPLVLGTMPMARIAITVRYATAQGAFRVQNLSAKTDRVQDLERKLG